MPTSTDVTINVQVTRRTRKSSRNLSGQVSNTVRKFYESRCVAIRGTIPDNPIKQHRQGLGLTIKQYATLVDLSEHAVIRAEQGFYLKVPETIINEIGGPVERLYDEWKEDSRRLHHRMFGDFTDIPFPNNVHPLDLLYKQWSITDDEDDPSPVGTVLNDTEVSKLLCINQSVIHYWHTSQRQQTIPSQFVEALIHNGYGDLEIQFLAAANEEFRKYKEGDKISHTKMYGSLIDEMKEAFNE